MSALHQAAGSKGGNEVVSLYGKEYMAALGAMGGRPTFAATLEKDRLLRQRAKSRNGRRHRES